MKKELKDYLMEYCGSDAYPFHMPGHKRQPLGMPSPESIDITEITDFDNLHHAEGILKTGQERLAAVFGADESFYLVNGSTCGLLAAISGCTKKGDRILVARNCHKAVYHGIYLMELETTYLLPATTECDIQGSIAPEDVKAALEKYPDIKAVLITSPTYDGVVSDVQAIADLAHEKNIPLIVDEAHGAHFGFSDEFPVKAHTLGADLCVESVHKTLPAYTQTAVLHMKKHRGDGETYYFDPERVKRFLRIYQTSSPSYVLMAGIDHCVALLQENGKALCKTFGQKLDAFYQSCQDLTNLEVYPAEATTGIWMRDPSKILIACKNTPYSGQELLNLLHDEYDLEMEMAAGYYVTALTTIMDTADGFARLCKALHEIDQRCEENVSQIQNQNAGHLQDAFSLDKLYQPGEQCMSIYQAMEADNCSLPISESAGYISAEFVYLYPPGIPILVPGERISQSTLDMLQKCLQQGKELDGMEDQTGNILRVLA